MIQLETTEKTITLKEFKIYIKRHSIIGIVYKVLGAFRHISFSDTKITLYNTKSERKHITSDTNRLIIPIDEIEKINISALSETSSIITLYPFGKMILFFQKS